jgi:hypothetical protein
MGISGEVINSGFTCSSTARPARVTVTSGQDKISYIYLLRVQNILSQYGNGVNPQKVWHQNLLSVLQNNWLKVRPEALQTYKFIGISKCSYITNFDALDAHFDNLCLFGNNLDIGNKVKIVKRAEEKKCRIQSYRSCPHIYLCKRRKISRSIPHVDFLFP